MDGDHSKCRGVEVLRCCVISLFRVIVWSTSQRDVGPYL